MLKFGVVQVFCACSTSIQVNPPIEKEKEIRNMARAQIYSCFKEAEAALVEVEKFETASPVRITNPLADEYKKRRFVQIGRGKTPTTPPCSMAIVGMGGKQVMTLPSQEAVPLSVAF